MLLHRVLTALIAIPIILAAIWLGPPWITAVAVAASAVGVWEAYRLYPSGLSDGDADAEQGLPTPLGGVWAVALVLAGELAATPSDFAKTALAICVAGCIISGLWMIAAWRGRRPAFAAMWLCLTPIYIGGAMATAVALRGLDQHTTNATAWAVLTDASTGLWWILLAILAVYAADTAAYAVGRLIGRHRMAPGISPGKTWEGTIGGLAGAVIATSLLGMQTPLGLPVWQAVATGVILGVVAPTGDLLESKIKRWAGVKDSGALFPGHGGMLDRLDSLLPCFIVVYIVATALATIN